jgi:serine/threonine-protein kinase RsbW
MESYTFELSNDGRKIEPLQQQLQEVLVGGGVRLKSVYAINLALGEWLENVIQYAFADAGDHQIRVECSLSASDLTMRVRDNGKAFDPTQFPGEAPEAGDIFAPRGIGLMRKLMDTVSYQREGTWNVLELRKEISRREWD